jgi:glutathione reductase (NADPH)
MAYDFDLYVIGAGSGGVRASRIAAGHGARVAVCEDYRVGGTCVIRGCVPKKLLVYGSRYGSDFDDIGAYGWRLPGEPVHDWQALIANKDREIDRLNRIYIGLLEGAGVTLHMGRGRMLDAHTVEVDGRYHTAEKILIATGGRPWRPSIPGAEHAITSNEAFHLERLPRRVVIVGGGYIAVEFAGIFSGLGAEVTQVLRRDRVLRGFDEEVRGMLQEQMTAKGVTFRTETELGAILPQPDGTFHALTKAVDETAGEEIVADLIMYATGRVPNTESIGLAKIGVTIDKANAVAVDEWSRTTVPNIWAVGDVTDRINLTPVALMEGHCFADTEFGGKPRKADHRDVAHAVFSQPEVAAVGLTEEEARLIHGEVRIFCTSFRPMKHTLTGHARKSFMKLVVDAASDRVIGVHMVGDDSAELIQGLAVAVKAGATKAMFDATVGIHPTAGEEFVTMRTARPEPQVHAKAAE